MTRLVAFLRLRAAGLGVAALLVVVLFSVLGPLVVSQRPDDVDILTPPFGPPSRAHLLGTDELGRDVLVRLMHGGRVDLLVGGVAMLVAVLAGTSIGLVGGLLGGWTDFALMRVTDTFMSVPAFFVMLTLLTLLGPAIPTIVLAIGLTSWMNVARVIRAEVLALRSLDYVEAARALGVSTPRLIVVHIVPNVVPSVIVASKLGEHAEQQPELLLGGAGPRRVPRPAHHRHRAGHQRDRGGAAGGAGPAAGAGLP
jgi:peptide/nickel transport system permease protein